MKIRKVTCCPYCGFSNYADFRIKKNQSIASTVVTCDYNEGGCDKEYVANARISIDVNILGTSKVVSKESEHVRTTDAASKEENGAVQGRSAALQYILKFAQERDFTEDAERKQLRALWTAYCLQYNLDCDTREYDSDVASIWAAVLEGTENPDASDMFFERRSFDLYLSEDLC